MRRAAKSSASRRKLKKCPVGKIRKRLKTGKIICAKRSMTRGLRATRAVLAESRRHRFPTYD